MFEIFIAFLLDIILGDPPYSWHPIRVIGRLIEKSELWLRSKITNERIGGGVQALSVPLLAFITVWAIGELAFRIHPLLRSAVNVYFLYSALAIKDLELHAHRVYTALRNRKPEAARDSLSKMVGRDTQSLNEREVIRATVETVAESYLDGVLSPLFFAAIGGAPLAIAYKAINTLDSMVGHKTPRYKEFGFFAAKLDELVNWIPARISWFLIGLGALFVNGRVGETWHTGEQEANASNVSNSVFPEAAFAGAIGVELGGINYYNGQARETPKIGYPARLLEKEDILVASRLMKASSWIALIVALISSYLIWMFWVKIIHHL
ncbi:MAG: cobalamin biosynthesis protein CobD [Candidatus Omnitrophica bacterium]|nr:cobalamin biosynthesis protein CobD [Candidatus Omnitrophota bacterium]